jgi:hypothetical protein
MGSTEVRSNSVKHGPTSAGITSNDTPTATRNREVSRNVRMRYCITPDDLICIAKLVWIEQELFSR